MEFYLSSYKIGGEKEVQQLKDLIPPNKKTAYISNALDFSDDAERRKQSEQSGNKTGRFTDTRATTY